MPLNVCLINPKFPPSFFGMTYLLPIVDGDKRSNMTPGALPLLAALAPEGVSVELLDENIAPIDWADLRRFDVIGITGMIVQHRRMLELLVELEGFSALIIAGGPYVSISPETFEGECDVLFVGEADETWPEFLRTLTNGDTVAKRYEQTRRTDMTTLPTPRHDLLDAKRYISVAVQFSRGCPFECEFCDIITIFGRRPRLKSTEQLLAEFDSLRRLGIRSVYLVDDNFIGNKVAAKKMLPELIAWQRRHGYPFLLSTEASINLADDAELIELMVQANFREVFVGLESPRAESLNETRKFQNTRGDSMHDKISRIRDGGLVVIAGFIVGFDNDDATIFEDQFRFIQENAIAKASVGILSPLPTTPLYTRLKAEGRLGSSDPVVAFMPARMSPRELRDGHQALLERLYEPEAFFARLYKGYRESAAFRRRRKALDVEIGVSGWKFHVLSTLGGIRTAARLLRAMSRRPGWQRIALAYFKVFVENVRFGRERLTFAQHISLCLHHWHYYLVTHERAVYFGNPILEARQPITQPS